jgi:lipid-A-disaccharide synthase
MNKEIFLFAGEKSGDLLGGFLYQALQNQLPNYHFTGVVGPEMRTAGMEGILRTEEFELLGFSEILSSLPKLWKQFRIVRDYILKNRPEATILIDYPGFNLKMAKSLRKHHYQGKIIQYISPTVWAWGKKRADKMAQTLDLLLTIYPFEQECFSNTPLNVKYVGNPLKEIIQKHSYIQDWASLFGIEDTSHLIAIFPGSRKGEIELNLPYQLKVAELLKKKDPSVTFAISCAHEKILPVMHRMLQSNSLKLNRDIFLLPKAYCYELMKDCRSALAKSGTVTLELALHKCPTVVMYKLSLLNRIIAQYLLRLNLPHYCIVNILANKKVYPELIEKGLSSSALFAELQKINVDGQARQTCIEECEQLAALFQGTDASDQAADAIKRLLC